MQKNRWEIVLLLLVCFFFLFFDMLINSYVSSATSVRGSCTPIRNPATFFFLRVLRGLEDAGESLWYKICYTVHVCPSAFAHVLLERVAKYSVFSSHVADVWHCVQRQRQHNCAPQSDVDLRVFTCVTPINDCKKWKNTDSVCNFLFTIMLRP